MTETAFPSTAVPLPSPPQGWHVAAYAILMNGNLAILCADADLAQEWRLDKQQGLLGKPYEVAARATAKVLEFDGEGLREGPIFPLETPFPLIDRFPDGSWLVASSRTDLEPNARIISSNGDEIARIMLGDGIEHLGVDRDGQIWVGWFDEGVFGNLEWRVPGQEWSPASQGLGLFSASGALLELPAFPPEAGDVHDCYALNVAEHGTWACTYSDFPIRALSPRERQRCWRNKLAGVKALAIDERFVLLAGGYGTEANRLALVKLEPEGGGASARVVASGKLPLLSRTPVAGEDPEMTSALPYEYPRLLTGRCDRLHMVYQESWHRWRVADALTVLSQES